MKRRKDQRALKPYLLSQGSEVLSQCAHFSLPVSLTPKPLEAGVCRLSIQCGQVFQNVSGRAPQSRESISYLGVEAIELFRRHRKCATSSLTASIVSQPLKLNVDVDSSSQRGRHDDVQRLALLR